VSVDVYLDGSVDWFVSVYSCRCCVYRVLDAEN